MDGLTAWTLRDLAAKVGMRAPSLYTHFQLLFTHVLGEWTPSADAYALSQRVYGRLLVDLAGMGITDPAHVDLWTALTSGLAAQQLANDLGGDRWHHLGIPGLVRRMKIPMDQSGSTAAGTPDQIRFDRLVDVIYTRDVWLHSVDIERTDGDGLLRTRLVF